MNKLSLILGNQLFPINSNILDKDSLIFMCEDHGLCSYEKHHKSKISLFFHAMRSYRDELESQGYKVIYYDFDNSFKISYIDKLLSILKEREINQLSYYEIPDKKFENEFIAAMAKIKMNLNMLKSPMFLDDRESFKQYIEGKKMILHGNYYKKRRKELNILMNNSDPIGGKWSFDEDNRKKLPKDYVVPKPPVIKGRDDTRLINIFIDEMFADHPGQISNLFPYTNKQAEDWLQKFFTERFMDFGPYEDAISSEENLMLHSGISSSLNLGLITPKQVIDSAINFSQNNDIPINSLEGFIRQIIGWREFINGIYQNFSDQMETTNYWNHDNKMTSSWYDGTTGIVPLDDAIHLSSESGYTHHINRLMVLANIMNLSRIDPNDIYHWFMEMFIDSSDWVMVPNVYGMGTFADGGIFSTKPYICGSSYILRMSDYKKGPWCDIVDGLYWLFINDNQKFFSSNPRLGLMINSLNKMKSERKEYLFDLANTFISKNTTK
mgnify:CR=1 FL=1